MVDEWNAIANAEVNKLLFAGLGAPMAIAGAAVAAPAIVGGTVAGVVTGVIALDYGQAHVRGLVNGSLEMQSTGGGSR
jgi:hypothetical protein